MNTYRKTGKIASIFVPVMFIFAAVQPARTYSRHGSTHAVYQSQQGNLAVTAIPQTGSVFLK